MQDRDSRPIKALLWAIDIFGAKVATDRKERARRMLEEAMELAQAEGLTAIEQARIADRVWRRTPGHLWQEIGQLQMTLDCLAANVGVSADEQAELEFARVQRITKEEWAIRHAAKVKLGIAK